jgi:hypothetical protein
VHIPRGTPFLRPFVCLESCDHAVSWPESREMLCYCVSKLLFIFTRCSFKASKPNLQRSIDPLLPLHMRRTAATHPIYINHTSHQKRSIPLGRNKCLSVCTFLGDSRRDNIQRKLIKVSTSRHLQLPPRMKA